MHFRGLRLNIACGSPLRKPCAFCNGSLENAHKLAIYCDKLCRSRAQGIRRGYIPRKSTEDRFWGYVDKSGTDGCWQWTGVKMPAGYGVFGAYRRNVMAHRFSYEEVVGPIPPGLHLDHLCRNTSCVNPDHLEPVTPAVNVLRGVGFAALNARKTHCKSGHEFTPENTYIRPDRSGRDCLECRRIIGRERTLRERAKREAERAPIKR